MCLVGLINPSALLLSERRVGSVPCAKKENNIYITNSRASPVLSLSTQIFPVVCITEGIPQADMIHVKSMMKVKRSSI